MEKEQSSILTPNNKLVGVKKSEKEPKLPQPTGWRLLVLPFKMKEKTKGGLVLAETTLEKQQVASQVGLGNFGSCLSFDSTPTNLLFGTLIF